jgi:hypothetical protein
MRLSYSLSRAQICSHEEPHDSTTELVSDRYVPAQFLVPGQCSMCSILFSFAILADRWPTACFPPCPC